MNRTGSSFYQNGMNVLGPKATQKYNTGMANNSLQQMNIEDMAEMPNDVGRHG